MVEVRPREERATCLSRHAGPDPSSRALGSIPDSTRRPMQVTNPTYSPHFPLVPAPASAGQPTHGTED